MAREQVLGRQADELRRMERELQERMAGRHNDERNGRGDEWRGGPDEEMELRRQAKMREQERLARLSPQERDLLLKVSLLYCQT